FPVPLGPQLDPQMLHGLAAATGGAPIRVLPSDRVEDSLRRLQETVSAPILYPTSFTLEGEVADLVPTRMPPLRGDSPTLVAGRLKAGEKLTYTVSGKLAGNPVRVTKEEAVPEAEVENFFLATMLQQWQGDKEAPAIIRADRALAYASETDQLARAD